MLSSAISNIFGHRQMLGLVNSRSVRQVGFSIKQMFVGAGVKAKPIVCGWLG
jgi:hypothetical protein